jgi:hypothetical protein
MMRLAGALSLMSMLWAATAHAQPAVEERREVARPVVVGRVEDGPRVGPLVAARELSLTERLLLREQWREYREHDRRSVNLAAPIVGLGLGFGATGLASWLIADEDRSERRLGAALAVIAVPMLATAIGVLSVRVKKRRAIEREIWSAPPIASSPLRWRF